MQQNIGIMGGGGQQGKTFIRKFKENDVDEARIGIFDINAARTAAVKIEFPGIYVADSLEDLARWATKFVVATNTPSHHEVVEQLIGFGAKTILVETGGWDILTEKPYAQNVVFMRRILALQAQNPLVRLLAAHVIDWSLVRPVLLELKRRGLYFSEVTGIWQKNRSDDSRPTVGDLLDELIHMVEFICGVVREDGLNTVSVDSAHLLYDRYVDEAVQQAAHERDDSFPLNPVSSTHAHLRLFVDGAPPIRCTFSSSFVGAQQIRQIRGTLCSRDGIARHSFVINFDVVLKEKRGDKVIEKRGDELILTDLKSKKPPVITFHEVDKMHDLTAAFMAADARGADERHSSAAWAGRFVELLAAIEESHKAVEARTSPYRDVVFGGTGKAALRA